MKSHKAHPLMKSYHTRHHRLRHAKDGCKASCPLGVDIHSVLDHVKRKEFQHARDLLETANPLPSITSRFCGAHCSGTCSCAKHFHAVERFLGDHYKPTQQKVKAGKQKVAVIGAGVAGLTVASLLRKQGLNVKLIEAMEKAGGSLSRSTPEFRLPSKNRATRSRWHHIMHRTPDSCHRRGDAPSR